jgi:hypothetical protein
VASLSLVFDILAKDRASQEFRKVGDAAEGAGKRAGGMGSAVKSAMKIAAGAIAAAGIGKMLGDSIKEASDLGESINAVNVTFGDAADGIKKLGKEAADAVGLSQSQFHGLAVQFSSFATAIAGKGGDVTKTMKDLTTRGADFASVMNLDVNEAMGIFQSGLAGESEPLRKFGIDLSAAAVESYAYANGIAESGKKLTETEKVQSRYGLLMEQTAKTQGDFANTSDSLANVQRRLSANWDNLQATVGQKVLPILEKVSGWVVDKGLPLLQRFGGWIQDKLGPIFTTVFGEIKGAIYAFAAAWEYNDGEITSSGLPGFMERVGYIARQVFDWIKSTGIPALKDFAGWINRNRDVIIPVTIALGSMLAAFKAFMFIKNVTLAVKAFNLMLLANPIGLVVAALAGLVTGLVIAYKRSDTFREIVDKAFAAVAAAGKWMWENVLKPAFGFLMDYWTAVAKAVMWAWENLIKPAWSALQSVISFLWKNVLKPYFTFIINLWTEVAKGIGRVWESILKPVFKTFGEWVGKLKEGFRTGVNAIGKIWDGLKSKLSAPVQWVVDVVWNNGLRKLWNTINNLWGGKNLPAFSMGGGAPNKGTSTRGGLRAANGAVLPGWSPGRDIHTFVSPTGGRLHLSGGEAVMVPEFTRAVGGKAGVDYLNQLARRQGDAALQAALGMGGQRLAKGGIIDLPGWLDALVGITPGMGGIKGILSSLTGGGAGGGLLGSGMVSLAKTVGSKMIGAAKSLFDDKNAATSTVTGWDRTGWTLMEDGSWLPPPHLRGIGKGVGNWQQMWAAVKSSPVGRFARLTSWLRPGDPGLHGQGRAIDIAGSVPYPMGNSRREMAAINRWIAANFPNSRELIYTPGINLFGGRPHTFNARTRGDHWDHVHWGMKDGGVLGAGVYDRGGLLPPGLTLAYNGTGKPERIRTAEQEAALRGPAQFVGNLYLDSGEFLGKVRGEARAVMTADKDRVGLNVRSAGTSRY